MLAGESTVRKRDHPLYPRKSAASRESRAAIMVLRCYWWGVALFVAAVLSGASALSADSYPACRSLNPDGLHHLTLGDGLCNEIYNIEDCGFDGGDCCPCTCEGQAQGEQASGE